MAFLLTLKFNLFDNATSIMVSVTDLTKVSGTIVAIIEKASDCAGSFLDLRSD